MELTRDDSFEEMGSTWLCLERWFVAAGTRVHPGLCFTSMPIQPDTSPSDEGEPFMRSPSFSFCEYGTSNAAFFFGESDESNADVETGPIEVD